MLDRRALLVALAGWLAAGPAVSAPKRVLRVNGRVSAANYRGLESFLFNSLDNVVGLRLSFEASEKGPDGTVAASLVDGKLFAAYLRGGGESEIAADEGYSLSYGSFVFDGFFVVKSGGMNQGIVSLVLERADEASVLLSGVPVEDIDIGRLRADIRKE